MGRDIDVVVVGANVAGASVAQELAIRGLHVTIVERLPGPEVGARSCGDGIERFQFEKLGLEVPQGDFILREVEVAYVASPDRNHKMKGKSAGIAIERYGLNQHLLSKATGAGADLMDNTLASSPILEGGRVVGVKCQARGDGGTSEVRAPVTVDATGWRGVLRCALPPEWPIAEEVPRRELAFAYREERRRAEPKGDLLVEATFDFEIAPQGLYWMADRTDTLVNVGIGMQWLPDIPNARRVLRERVVPLYPDLEGTEVIRSGGGVIPNRRPIDCFAAPGIVALGDAACQVQPLSGSGIGASMYAAKLAGEAIAKALETTRAPGLGDLFPYVVAYQRSYGADQAANQVLRLCLQSLTNAQLNRLISSRIVAEEDLVAAARTGRLHMGFKGKLRAAAKLVGEPKLIRTLSRMQSKMEDARHLYAQYPEDPSGLRAWREQAAKLFAST